MKKHLTYLFCLWAFILSAQTPTRPGRDYAVFFYVTDFQTGWPRLPETKTEAEALKTELDTNFNFTCEMVANPTKQQMLDKIRQYNERLTENDQLLYFFSMHGHFDTVGDRGYLIGKDGLLNDEYGNTWLNYDDMRTYLSRCKAKHVLLALDACHSGSFGIRNKSRPDAPDNESGTDCATKVSQTMKYTGRQYCTSGNKDAKTPAKSLFAARFLEALRKGGEGGVLRFDDLEYYLGKVENPKPECGSFGKHDSGGDFIFVSKGACVSFEIIKQERPQGQEISPTLTIYHGGLSKGIALDYNDGIEKRGWLEDQGGIIKASYPGNLSWGAVLFHFVKNTNNKAISENCVNLGEYKSLLLEMRGDNGTEQIEIGMMDCQDERKGQETKLLQKISNQWKIYSFSVHSFLTCDLSQVNVPIELVFHNNPAIIYIKSICLSK